MPDIRRLPTEARGQLAPLLNLHSPADATAAYYALDHPAERVELYVEYAGNGSPRGFVALAQTGLDLFRRLVLPFAAHPLGLASLLKESLRPRQPVLLLLPLEQESWINGLVELSDAGISDVYRLHTSSFQPVLNVMVVAAESPGGGARFEIRSASGAHAAAGANWRGPRMPRSMSKPTPKRVLEASPARYWRPWPDNCCRRGASPCTELAKWTPLLRRRPSKSDSGAPAIDRTWLRRC